MNSDESCTSLMDLGQLVPLEKNAVYDNWFIHNFII